MSTTRLLVLGMLAERGPMHGHQLRRQAELVNVEAWGGVRVGALYGALHRMEAEGLIEPLRSEQPGRFGFAADNKCSPLLRGWGATSRRGVFANRPDSIRQLLGGWIPICLIFA